MTAQANSAAANWPFAKRLVHWGIALAVLTALVAPKPEDGEGLLHIFAGSTAAALVMVRIGWRLIGNVRPYLRDSLKLRAPKTALGARGFAPPLMQGARLGGFLFLALIPAAVGLGLAGVAQGEESAPLEAHEAVGTAIIWLAVAHAVAMVAFALIMKYDLLGITVAGPARALSEGGLRGFAGMVLGAAIAAAGFAYVWGPFDVAGKAAGLEEREGGGGGEGRYDDD